MFFDKLLDKFKINDSSVHKEKISDKLYVNPDDEDKKYVQDRINEAKALAIIINTTVDNVAFLRFFHKIKCSTTPVEMEHFVLCSVYFYSATSVFNDVLNASVCSAALSCVTSPFKSALPKFSAGVQKLPILGTNGWIIDVLLKVSF